MQFKRVLPILLAAGLGIGASSLMISYPGVAQVIQAMGNGQINWSEGQIKVTGSGAAPSKAGMGVGQKRLLAQRAAVADAYRQLAELINGVQVDSETLVKDYVVESDIVRTKVSALIKGARLGKPRFMSDGTVEIDVMMGVFGQNSLSSVMIPEVIEKKEIKTMPYPHATPVPQSTPEPAIDTNPPVGGSYTGLIIDGRGLGLSPAMSPQILDLKGREIYIGDMPIDPDMVVNVGIVGYADSLSAAKSNTRVGRNPLIIKAAKAGGRNKSDALVSNAEGDQIMAADQKTRFLSGSKVIFIIDK